MSEFCPDCNTEIQRQYGLPGVVSTCPKCGKRWIKCLDRLISEHDFHERADAER
jgi:Zn-finger nucleic acid-binding protein